MNKQFLRDHHEVLQSAHLDYLRSRYPLSKVFSNPAQNGAANLYMLLVLQDMQMAIADIRNVLCGEIGEEEE